MIRAVLDVNILVSSLLGPLGFSRRIVEAWAANDFVVVTSEGIIQEVTEKLGLDRIRRRLHVVAAEDVPRLLRLLRNAAEIHVVPSVQQLVVTGDPEDDYVLATGRVADADYLVMGDDGLLALRRYGRMEIVTPRAFFDLLQSGEQG